MYIRGGVFSLSILFMICISWFAFVFAYFRQTVRHSRWYWMSSILSLIGFFIAFPVPTKKLTIGDSVDCEQTDNVIFWARAVFGFGFITVVAGIFFQFTVIDPIWNVVYVFGYLNPLVHIVAVVILLLTKMWKGGVVIEVKKRKLSKILYKKLKESNQPNILEIEQGDDDDDETRPESSSSSDDDDEDGPELMPDERILYIRISLTLKRLVHCNVIKWETIKV